MEMCKIVAPTFPFLTRDFPHLFRSEIEALGLPLPLQWPFSFSSRSSFGGSAGEWPRFSPPTRPMRTLRGERRARRPDEDGSTAEGRPRPWTMVEWSGKKGGKGRKGDLDLVVGIRGKDREMAAASAALAHTKYGLSSHVTCHEKGLSTSNPPGPPDSRIFRIECPFLPPPPRICDQLSPFRIIIVIIL